MRVINSMSVILIAVSRAARANPVYYHKWLDFKVIIHFHFSIFLKPKKFKIHNRILMVLFSQTLFNKQYVSVEEESYRRSVFAENTSNITKHNEQYDAGNVTYKLSMNQFGDMVILLKLFEHVIVALFYVLKNEDKHIHYEKWSFLDIR